MTMSKLALFDFDGTLIDSTTWFHRTVNEAARRHKFRELSEEEREMLRHRSSREILRYCGVPHWKLPAITRTVQAAMARDIDEFEPFPFVTPLFTTLAERNIRIAIVSSNNAKNIRHILGAELAKHVDHFETGAKLFGKAGRFKRAMRKLGATRAVTIGDEERDITAARKVGIPILSVTWGFAGESVLEKANPENIIHDPAMLEEAIDKALSA